MPNTPAMLRRMDFVTPPVDLIQDPWLDARGVRLQMLRLDRVHPDITGNKGYKLRCHLQRASEEGHTTVLSFGGAYSNHLVALAAAGVHTGLRTVGVVRGELVSPLNPCLQLCEQRGMRLYPVSRERYREKESSAFVQALRAAVGDFYLIPEGGGGLLGVLGAREIAAHIVSAIPCPARVVLACGTGTTLAGIVAGLPPPYRVIGISVLKGEDTLSQQVTASLQAVGASAPCPWEILTGFHEGGYARQTPALRAFIDRFEARTGIPLEGVYTGKMMKALYTLIAQGDIAPGESVLAVHTGGLVPFSANVEKIPT